MEIFQAIRDRRSIRKFKSDPIPEGILDKIVEAGRLAPSAGNLQRRKFVVLTGEAKRNFNVPTIGRFKLGDEPALIVVCADTTPIEKYGDKGELYLQMDCAASIMSMMLVAHSLGLGTCWVGSFDGEVAKRLLRLPENLRPLTLIPIGFPDEKPEMPSRKPVSEVCEFLDVLPI